MERDEEAVNIVEPASIKERDPTAEQAVPGALPRSRSCSGAVQPTASLPPDTEVNRTASAPVLSKMENSPSPLVVSNILKIDVLPELLTTCRMSSLPAAPLTVSFFVGEAVPIPIFPADVTRIRSVLLVRMTIG